MKLSYIAMPYSHPSAAVIQERMETCYKMCSVLLNKGKFTISPVQNHPICKRYNIPVNYQFWGDYSRTLIARCDELIVLKMYGWNESEGVLDEIRQAIALNIPIIYVDPYEE